MKKYLNKKNITIAAGIVALIVIAAVILIITNKKAKTLPAAPPPTEDIINVEKIPRSVNNYSLAKNSHVYITINRGEKIDITKHTDDVNKGELILTESGLEKVFGLKKTAADEEDNTAFASAENDHGFSSLSGPCLKFSNDKHTILVKNGSKLYLVDGIPAILSASIYSKNGSLCFPVSSMIFALGYTQLGISVLDNDISYSLIK